MTSPSLARFLRFLRPPPAWRLPVLFVLSVLTGIALLVLKLSNAPSYLSDDPATCVNCHVMAPQYATWQHGSHSRVATCNDCHVPQDNPARKLMFKASDGMRHATMFTFRLEPQVIEIKEAGKVAVQENCVRCHQGLLDRVPSAAVGPEDARHGRGKVCWDCHRETPHGRVNSLASAPNARIPNLSPPLPQWMESVLHTQEKKPENGHEADR